MQEWLLYYIVAVSTLGFLDGKHTSVTYDPSDEEKKAKPFAMAWSSSGRSVWQGATLARTRIPTPVPLIIWRPAK